jgi:hypothetical protein
MNKFTIEADGEMVEVELRSSMSSALDTLYIDGGCVVHRRAERVYNVLRKTLDGKKELTEAAKAVLEAHEAHADVKGTLVAEALYDLRKAIQ